MRKKLLGIQIDYVRLDQAVETVKDWLGKKGKHYIVTPNPEMLTDAQSDEVFKRALNSADLSIPDSLRLGWGSYLEEIKNPILRLIYSPSFLFPHVLPRFVYPKTAGIDLMEALLSLSEEKAYTTAYLGGTKKVADKLFKCLRTKYPRLKIAFCAGNMAVNNDGIIQFDTKNNTMTGSKQINDKAEPEETSSGSKNSLSSGRLLDSRLRGNDGNGFNAHLLTQKIDVIFVAFGHRKQEKWMYQNLPKLNTRVMVGVGGSFDYLSGEVPRAPRFIQEMGLEWLFRVIIQPWRLKRFWKLVYFVFRVVKGN